MNTNRFPQGRGTKGSKKWIQDVINQHPAILDSHIRAAGCLPDRLPVSWQSPLATDEYSEYRDAGFLERLDLSLHKDSLRQFWPSRGPQWDALGVQKDLPRPRYYVVEAKANIPEIVSTCQAEDPDSVRLIESSLDRARTHFGAPRNPVWLQGFYQYANRLAHLYFLREIAKVDAILVLVYFLNDRTHIPTTEEAWRGAIALQNKLMGISDRSRQKVVCEVFVNTGEITG